ncbi:uncharacterized protein LOC126834512 [Adelges cooleyi]|uniref:uncharacterized protein LOC126834512 n=1 Tax=Adelges cooleyi TaxID=133065 RepID=UPI0021809764|nr:uncharacterized protein LOC126834512 [Adelges cooleyi]
MEAYYMWERVHLTEDMSRPCNSCDCITYSYFLISVFLFTLGMVICIFSIGPFDNTIFSDLSHLWMFGPLCICSALMIGIRNVLYLRRRHLIDLVLLEQIEDIRAQQVHLADSQQYSMPIRSVSELTLPPSYDQLVSNQIEEDNDLPPPSYEEAIVGMPKETTKSDNILVLNYSVK